MSPQTLRRSYKEHYSGYREWDQGGHAEEYLLFPDNLTTHISIDEVSLSRGELYTFVTAKTTEGKNGRLIASIKGTKASVIAEVLGRLDIARRQSVREVSMDMAKNMENAIKRTFTRAQIVTDRFHVIQLVQGCLQQVRISLWRAEMDAQNKAMREAKKAGRTYTPEELTNGDTPKQLLSRVRYQLYKHPHEHQNSGKERVKLAFSRYPELERAYRHAQELRAIYTQKTKEKAQAKLDKWIQGTYHHEHETFYSAAKSLTYFTDSILAYYNNRSTNAGAESFNAKIKLFRANQRGVRDTTFFLFRLTKLYA